MTSRMGSLMMLAVLTNVSIAQVSGLSGTPEKSAFTAEHVAALIEELDDKEFATRQKATEKLLRIGKAAYFPTLAASKTGSVERRSRARAIAAELRLRVSEYAYADVSRKGNQKLAKGFFGSQDNHLRQLPQGNVTLDGFRFRIGMNCIQTSSKSTRVKLPAEVRGIPAKGTCDRLHFLHGTHWGSPRGVADGTQIGRYDVHYADGSTVRVPIEYGHDVRDWWNWDNSRATKRAREVWTGINPASANYRGQRIPLRLFARTWKNPRPDVAIERIDFASTNDTISAPFCVAITLETPPKQPSLVGTWEVMSSKSTGESDAPAVGARYVFGAQTLTVEPTKGRAKTVTCLRDRTTAPPPIDLFESTEENASPSRIGLYDVHENHLVLYFGRGGDVRPKSASADDPLTTSVVRLMRVPDEE